MVIFLNKDAGKSDYARIEKAIRGTGNVEKLTFKTKQQSIISVNVRDNINKIIKILYNFSLTSFLDVFGMYVSLYLLDSHIPIIPIINDALIIFRKYRISIKSIIGIVPGYIK